MGFCEQNYKCKYYKINKNNTTYCYCHEELYKDNKQIIFCSAKEENNEIYN